MANAPWAVKEAFSVVQETCGLQATARASSMMTIPRRLLSQGKPFIMGRVLTQATIENLKDLYAVELGILKPDQARRIDVPDALADTGATMLSLPSALIRQLGLTKTGRRRVNSSLGLG
jgi:hypothetical protein